MHEIKTATTRVQKVLVMVMSLHICRGVAKDLHVLWVLFGLTVGLVSATCGPTVWLWVPVLPSLGHTAQEDPAKYNPPG